jgi:hypothetical protein
MTVPFILFPDLWTNDLVNVGYEDVPAIRDSLDVHYPCIGQNALVGVYFYPSVIEARLKTSALSRVSRNGNSIMNPQTIESTN